MEHLAIMTHGYIEKILSGMKTIESRFSVNRIAPYGKISQGDIVYLQETGKKVTATFRVRSVLSFSDLSPEIINEIKKQYGKEICADDEFWKKKQNSRYATLIFISDPQLIEPFEVYKKDRSAFKSCNSVNNDLVINKRKIVKHCHDCSKGKHYYVYNGTKTQCEFCGAELIHSSVLKTRPDYETIKGIMKTSMWNNDWFTADLDNVAASTIGKISLGTIRHILTRSIAELTPTDGKQTPYYGSVVYYAQHALGCCCRKCLEKFYGIERSRQLTQEEMDYFVSVVNEFVKEKVYWIIKVQENR